MYGTAIYWIVLITTHLIEAEESERNRDFKASMRRFMGAKYPLKVTYIGDLADQNITCKMDRVWNANDNAVFFERTYRDCGKEHKKNLTGTFPAAVPAYMKVFDQGVYMQTEELVRIDATKYCGIFYTTTKEVNAITGRHFLSCEMRIKTALYGIIDLKDYGDCKDLFEKYCSKKPHYQIYYKDCPKPKTLS